MQFSLKIRNEKGLTKKNEEKESSHRTPEQAGRRGFVDRIMLN